MDRARAFRRRSDAVVPACCGQRSPDVDHDRQMQPSKLWGRAPTNSRGAPWGSRIRGVQGVARWGAGLALLHSQVDELAHRHVEGSVQ